MISLQPAKFANNKIINVSSQIKHSKIFKNSNKKSITKQSNIKHQAQRSRRKLGPEIQTPPSKQKSQTKIVRQPAENSDFFTNGKIASSNIGRTVIVDRVLYGVKKSFSIKLMEYATDMPAQNNNNVDQVTNSSTVIDIDSSFSTVSVPPKKTMRPRKKWTYTDFVVKKLRERANGKHKKQSFKNLILSYRTLQKNAMKKNCFKTNKS